MVAKASFVGMLTGISLQGASLSLRWTSAAAVAAARRQSICCTRSVAASLCAAQQSLVSQLRRAQMLTNAAPALAAAPAYYYVSGPSTLNGTVLTRNVGLDSKLAPRTLIAKRVDCA